VETQLDLLEGQMKAFGLFLLFAVACSAVWAGDEEEKRLAAATETLKEIMAASDKAVPQELFNKASCAVVVPGMKKGGFIVAGKYGRGFASCRGSLGGWRAPLGLRIEGGSFGLQVGGSETDVVMLVMNQKGMERLTSSKFTLGGDVSVAAGPVGRSTTAQTDITMKAEILSWSRSRGVFGGVALDGATLRPDEETNTALYGKGVEPKAVVEGKVKNTPAGTGFTSTLSKYSPAKAKK
jgi:lipid-binding SYLF domain-containing protein